MMVLCWGYMSCGCGRKGSWDERRKVEKGWKGVD